MTPKSNQLTALYPGSFNPFTIGHLDIARRALSICHRLVIGVGINIDKPAGEAEHRAEEIRRIFSSDENVEVRCYRRLTAEFAKEIKADFIIRGIRDSLDFEAERRMAEANMRLFGIETIFLNARPDLGWLSSSAVRELKAFGYDVAELIP